MCTLASPLGKLTLACDGRALTGLWIAGQKYENRGLAADCVLWDGARPLVQARCWLERYFAGQRPVPAELPLSPSGSPFQRLVWELLCQIPYGQCVSYGSLARQLAERMGRAGMSAQAVGGAVGHNPISIIIPCHRVLGADGSLTGYAGGLEKKAWLLAHEGVDLSGHIRSSGKGGAERP